MGDKKPTVLIVDDDKFLVNMYSLKFSNSGFVVLTAQNGQEALKKLKEERLSPDALLLDIVMPSMNGLELLASIRKENLAEHSKVIFLTNQGVKADIETSKKLGVSAYIVKASTIPSEVVTMVKEILEKHEI